MQKTSKVLVLGSRGLVGSALVNQLQLQSYQSVLIPTRNELDLFRQTDVEQYFGYHKPEYVFVAAARVGGILANSTQSADFIFENLQIQQNIFNAALRAWTPNLLFMGSSCIYPRLAPQPIKEESLLTLPLEQTNESYAIAKIAGLKTVQAVRNQYHLNWISVMPTNLYGIQDNFDSHTSHVIPGLIARMYEAKEDGKEEFSIWGTGKPSREFLYVDDLAKACLHIMETDQFVPDFINIGSGVEIEIAELAKLIADKLEFKGRLIFDSSKPDGTPRKLLDNSKIISLGWKPEVSLDEGLDLVIKNYVKSQK